MTYPKEANPNINCYELVLCLCYAYIFLMTVPQSGTS